MSKYLGPVTIENALSFDDFYFSESLKNPLKFLKIRFLSIAEKIFHDFNYTRSSIVWLKPSGKSTYMLINGETYYLEPNSAIFYKPDIDIIQPIAVSDMVQINYNF